MRTQERERIAIQRLRSEKDKGDAAAAAKKRLVISQTYFIIPSPKIPKNAPHINIPQESQQPNFRGWIAENNIGA